MKQKNNIFEELNKMKNLIHAKAGVVISEQANTGADVGAIMQELNKTNSDEQKIVNIVKKYKDKASLKAFTDQYKTISGKDFGEDIRRALFGGQDSVEIEDLKKHLSSLGVTLGDAPYVKGKLPSYTLGGLDAPAAAAPEELTKREELWKTTYSCAPSQPGAKAIKLKDGTTSYLVGQIYYYNTGRKKLADGTMKNYSCSTEFKSGNNKSNDYARIVGDYSKKVQTSLGASPTGQLSDNDLEKILSQLSGEVSGGVNQTVQGLPTTADGQPDLEKILASL